MADSSSSAKYLFEGDAFFNPQLQLEDGEKKAKVESVLSELRLNASRVEELRLIFGTELKYGLQQSPARPSAYPMYNTFATRFPSGVEVGDFLGMDIGGTNLRVVYLKLWKADTGKYEHKLELDFYDVPSEVRKSNSKAFFGFLAASVKDFVEKKGLASLDKTLLLGFTFSFGYEQLSIDRGVTVKFGIETHISDAVGKDPTSLMQAHLDALGVPVRIVVLANDATATLIYGKYLDQETQIGLIMGSGTNIAYIEEVSKFGPITDAKETFGEEVDRFIVNTDHCVMGDKGELDHFMTRFDKLVDDNSFLPKVYVFPKLMGGAFLGESLRYILLTLVQSAVLLGGKVTAELATKGAITSADISAFEAEFEANGGSAKMNTEVTFLLTRLGYSPEEITDDDRAIVTFAGQMVTTRAALLVAASLSVFVDHLAHLKVVKVACDGSLFRKHPKMARLVNGFLGALSPDTKAKVFDAEQGSCVGVAFMAAIAGNSASSTVNLKWA